MSKSSGSASRIFYERSVFVMLIIRHSRHVFAVTGPWNSLVIVILQNCREEPERLVKCAAAWWC